MLQTSVAPAPVIWICLRLKKFPAAPNAVKRHVCGHFTANLTVGMKSAFLQ